MRKYYLQAIGLIMMFAFHGTLFSQQVEFDIRFEPSTGEYEVYARPDSSNPTFFVGGGSQISIVFPSSLDNNPIPITSVGGGLWFDNSTVYAPLADPNHDFHAIASNGAMTSMTAGQEILLFTFSLPSGCANGVRLFDNSIDPQSSDAGMAGGDFNNYFADVFTLQDNYWQNYDNEPIVCDSDGDGLTDSEEITGIDDPSTPNIPTGTSEPDDICDPYLPTIDAVASYTLNTDCSPSDLSFETTITEALGTITDVKWNGPNGFESFDASPSIPNVTTANNGEYILKVSDSNGCFAQKIINVQNIVDAVPQPQIIAQGSFCEGETVSLNTGLYQGTLITYTWTFPSTATSIMGQGTNEIIIPVINTNTEGEYNVTVNVDGCVLTANTFTVTALDAPSLAVSYNNTAICEGADLMLEASSASNNVTYSWQGPESFTSTLENPTLSNVTTLNNGQYLVTVTNADGCKTAGSVLVNTIVPAPAVPTLLADAQLCEGSDIVLTTAAVGAQYEWIGPLGDSPTTLALPGLTTSNGSTSLAMNHPSYQTGEWKVRVTDANGCVVESELVEVTINEVPVAFAENEGPVCELVPVKLIAGEITNGTYEWYDNDPDDLGASPPANLISMEKEPIISDLAAGEYDFYLKVKKNNCTSELTAKTTVQVNAIPEISTISENGTYCEGMDVILTATNNNTLTGDITYTWTGPNAFNFSGTANANGPFEITIPNIDTNMEGIYQLQLETTAGCVSTTESVLVSLDASPSTPTLSAQTDILCEGETIELNVPPYSGTSVTYEWFFDDGTGNVSYSSTNSPTLLIPNAEIANSGVYSIEVTVNGCTSQVSNTLDIMVQGVQSSPEATNTTSTTEPACEGDVVQLSVPFFVGASYEWFGPNGFTSNLPTPVITAASVNDAGQYYAVISLPNNCATVVSTTTLVNVQAIPTTPTITNSGSVCEGGNVLLSVSSPLIVPPGVALTFEWFFAATNTLVATTNQPEFELVNLTSQEAGQYYMVLTVGNCVTTPTAFTTVTIDDISQNEAYAGDDFEICTGSTTTLDATNPTTGSGLWTSPSGATIVNAELANTEVTNLAEGENTFIWTLSNGVCENYDMDTVIITVTEQSTDIANAGLDFELCNLDDVNLNATIPSVASGTWTQSVNQAGQGVVIANPSDPNTAVTGLESGNSYTFTWSLTQGNCNAFSSDDVTITVYEIPVDLPYINMPEVVYLCEAEDITLEAVAPTTATGLWTSNTSALIVNASSNSTIAADLELGENIFVWSLSNGVCENYAADTIHIFVEEALIANADSFDIVFNDSLQNANLLLNDYISNVEEWDFIFTQVPKNGSISLDGDGIISYTPIENFFGSDTLVYRLCNVNCPSDCDTAMVVFNITGVSASGDCFTPNALTPNGDGVNDRFMIACLESFDENNITIFNRWGDEVYRSADYQNNWEGTHNGKDLPAGTYFYILDYKINGIAQSLQGYITLFR